MTESTADDIEETLRSFSWLSGERRCSSSGGTGSTSSQ